MYIYICVSFYLGIPQKCDKCEFTAMTKGQIKYHKDLNHGNEYSCDKCEFTGTKYGLTRHLKMKHVAFSCDYCDKVFNSKLALNDHIECKHDSTEFPCAQCDFVAPGSKLLRYHIAAQHQERRYPCDKCEYVALESSKLKRHKRMRHEGRSIDFSLGNYLFP